jgi:hypothetical protein
MGKPQHEEERKRKVRGREKKGVYILLAAGGDGKRGTDHKLLSQRSSLGSTTTLEVSH